MHPPPHRSASAASAPAKTTSLCLTDRRRSGQRCPPSNLFDRWPLSNLWRPRSTESNAETLGHHTPLTPLLQRQTIGVLFVREKISETSPLHHRVQHRLVAFPRHGDDDPLAHGIAGDGVIRTLLDHRSCQMCFHSSERHSTNCSP